MYALARKTCFKRCEVGCGFLPVMDQQTGRESIRRVYEDPKEGCRLVVGVDKDDGVPIVFSLHRRE